jgi:hypothetical protein
MFILVLMLKLISGVILNYKFKFPPWSNYTSPPPPPSPLEKHVKGAKTIKVRFALTKTTPSLIFIPEKGSPLSISF